MELMKLQSDHKPGNCRAALAGIVRFYETLAPDTLDQLAGLYAADARFKDPFNDVVGIAAITGIFRHMFTTVEAPRFEVTTRLLTGREAMLGWDFHLRLRGRPVVIHGVTHLSFDTDGPVCLHRATGTRPRALRTPASSGADALAEERLASLGWGDGGVGTVDQ
jgi:hypothetical protein